jgi:acetyl esterase/lipase
MLSALAKTSSARILAVNYRLAPAAKFDEILADGMAAFDYLLDAGVSPKKILVGGDSAGGHLALSVCATLAQSRPQLMPVGCLALSPWIDTHMYVFSCRACSPLPV